MNFSQNLYQWFLTNAQSLVLLAIVVIALITVGLVFNAQGVKNVLLNLFNKIVGA
jgi:hypothetical protein